MALSCRKQVLPCFPFINICWLALRTIATIQNPILSSTREGDALPCYNYSLFQLCLGPKLRHIPFFQHLSTSLHPERKIPEGSNLLRKLETALEDHQINEAWKAFNDFKGLYGFPHSSVLSKLITELSYSESTHWLQKASNIVCSIQIKKGSLLQPDILVKLSLSLSRAQMPNPTSVILRIMLKRSLMPPKNVLSTIFLHMVKSEIGTHLASNLLVQIIECYHILGGDKSTLAKNMKPDTVIFNLVLDACVKFKISFKGQQLIDLMGQIGVVADAHSIICISLIYEMCFQRDEVRKFKYHIDRVSLPMGCHYNQFYASLLSLHFKFNDTDSASELILDIYKRQDVLSRQEEGKKDLSRPCLVPIGSENLRTGLKLHIAPEILHKDSVLKMECKQELIICRSGRLVPSDWALAKLIVAYQRNGKITELSKVLITIQNELGYQEEGGLCSDVISACIQVGWLEIAHDILEDMEKAESPLGLIAYLSLLTAYYERKMVVEAKALLKQMKKVGLATDISGGPDSFLHISTEGSTAIGTSRLAEYLVQEMREESTISPLVHKFNSSLYFFCKAKMIDDAKKTYRRMQEMKVQPTGQTFANLLDMYSSLEMHREITILWGDIKRNMEVGGSVVSRDLLEFLLLNFLRGGYFERVMEVGGCMTDRNMYTDKSMYKSEFLKFHKGLYRKMEATEAKTEAQRKRIEFVVAFRKWVGIG